MSELDEQRIKELAKLTPHVLCGADGSAAREEARKVLECLALIRTEGEGPHRGEDGAG